MFPHSSFARLADLWNMRPYRSASLSMPSRPRRTIRQSSRIFPPSFSIEVDGALVPVEHRPLHAPAVSFLGKDRQLSEHGRSDSRPAVGGLDVDVFEVEPLATEKGRVVVEEHGGADSRALDFGDQGLGSRLVSEEGRAAWRWAWRASTQSVIFSNSANSMSSSWMTLASVGSAGRMVNSGISLNSQKQLPLVHPIADQPQGKN